MLLYNSKESDRERKGSKRSLSSEETGDDEGEEGQKIKIWRKVR